MAVSRKIGAFVLCAAAFCAPRCLAQLTPVPAAEKSTVAEDTRPADPALTGCITGSIIDPSGAVVTGAQIKLTRNGQPLSPTIQTGTDGQFFVANIAPGAFDLTISASGFNPKTYSGTLRPNEINAVPPIVMDIVASVTEVSVALNRVQIGEEEVRQEEHQRILGLVPNFYVSYDPHAVPLTAHQKFRLATRTIIDPFTFVAVAGTAGIEQWQGHFIGYGQGFDGYAKRFGANYADTITGTFIGGAIFPAILKQDPRYFYKGTGSIRARFSYAIAMAFICKGDNGHWQPNYSGVLGSLAAGGISNLYYPAADRNSLSLTLDNTAIGVASNALGNLFEEFIVPKLSKNARRAQGP